MTTTFSEESSGHVDHSLSRWLGDRLLQWGSGKVEASSIGSQENSFLKEIDGMEVRASRDFNMRLGRVEAAVGRIEGIIIKLLRSKCVGSKCGTVLLLPGLPVLTVFIS